MKAGGVRSSIPKGLAWLVRSATAGVLIAAGAAPAQPGPESETVIRVRPEPIGLARSFLGTRGGGAGGVDWSEPEAAGLAPAEPGELPQVQARALATSSLRTTTTLRLQSSIYGSSTGSTSTYNSTYRPLTTTVDRTSLYSASTPYARPLVQSQPAVRIQPAIVPDRTVALPRPFPPVVVGGGTGVNPPPPVDDPFLDDPYERLRRAQAEEHRAQLEREQQRRVFELLQGKVEEIALLRERRREERELALEAQRDIRGPSALAAVNLFEGLYVDRGIELQQAEILRIDHHVYQDANPDTGLFYYSPKRYDLQWDPDNQYAMTVIFGMAGQNQGEGEVYMATRLQAGVDLAELKLAEELLLAYLRRNAGDGSVRFRELRPLPLAASSDVQLFGGAKNQFTVPPEKISVQGITGLLDSMDVSWATDVRRLLNVESLLRTDAGIHGRITMHASGEEGLSRVIPLEIAVASDETFGRIRFDPGGWVNRSRYPVRLGTLHALLLSPEDGNGIRRDQPVVATWQLGDAVVPPGGRVAWDLAAVPAWIGSEAKLLWVDYSVDGACESCDDLVFTEKFIPPPPSTRQILFTTGDAFESTGAFHMRVHVRSPFLDPQRSRVLVRPSVMLEQDGVETPIARLFLTDREMSGEGAEEPFYEYRIDVVMRDGEVFQSDWVPSRTLDVLVGSASLERAFGFLPGAQPAPADEGSEPQGDAAS